jgi:uncharacterized lipoprotein YajG
MRTRKEIERMLHEALGLSNSPWTPTPTIMAVRRFLSDPSCINEINISSYRARGIPTAFVLGCAIHECFQKDTVAYSRYLGKGKTKVPIEPAITAAGHSIGKVTHEMHFKVSEDLKHLTLDLSTDLCDIQFNSRQSSLAIESLVSTNLLDSRDAKISASVSGTKNISEIRHQKSLSEYSPHAIQTNHMTKGQLSNAKDQKVRINLGLGPIVSLKEAYSEADQSYVMFQVSSPTNRIFLTANTARIHLAKEFLGKAFHSGSNFIEALDLANQNKCILSNPDLHSTRKNKWDWSNIEPIITGHWYGICFSKLDLQKKLIAHLAYLKKIGR